jgi:hypothetical protein
MCTDPANKQMDLPLAKDIFADQSIIIAGNIKNHPAGAPAQQISLSKGRLNIRWRIPICMFQFEQPFPA